MALIGRHALIGRGAGPGRPYHWEWDEVVASPLYTARRLRVPPGREAGRRRQGVTEASVAAGRPAPQPLQRTAVMQP
ncbi:hypothetical protein GCM10010187_19260 [Actinomadura coerulea]|nr:hypothetical protein GCM10010187_19260 [Actinomadura coerulea]